MKRVCESGADRITDLPADVIERILVFLPIKDAAKTSVLSRTWRHRWRIIPELVFDDGFANLVDEDESEWEVTSKQVMLNIYQCLLLHDGPITKFVLSIVGLAPCPEMDLIILYLSNKGVQHFTVKIMPLDDGIGYYQMSCSLFSALHLKSLMLESCKITPPYWSVGCSELTHLQLDSVTLPSDFFENYLPKGPMLESLELIFCKGLDGKLQIVAPLLKTFTYWGSRDIRFKSTPLLSDVSLHLTGGGIPDMLSLFASLPRLQKLCVNHEILKYFARADNVPTRLATPLHLLQVLKIEGLGFYGSGMERGFVCLITSCPNLRRLTVQCLAAGDKNFPTRLPTPLHGLEYLSMSTLVFNSSEMERVLVCLIMSSPNLRTLRIEVSTRQLDVQPSNDGVTSIRRLLEAEAYAGSSDCLQHLRELRIGLSCGTQDELDLVRFVLATAPLLRLIHIWPHYKLGTKKVTEFMKEVMQCKRISKDAEIIFNWTYEED